MKKNKKKRKSKTNIWFSVNKIFCSSMMISRCMGVSELSRISQQPQ